MIGLVFTHGTGLVDRLIQLWTHSHWNHVALRLPDGSLVEAVGQGIRPAPGDKYDHGDYDQFTIPLGESEERDVVAYAQAMVARHERYGFLTIATIALALLTGFRLVVELDGTLICSEFAARALEHGGLIFDRDAALISPEDLRRQALAHASFSEAKVEHP